MFFVCSANIDGKDLGITSFPIDNTQATAVDNGVTISPNCADDNVKEVEVIAKIPIVPTDFNNVNNFSSKFFFFSLSSLSFVITSLSIYFDSLNLFSSILWSKLCLIFLTNSNRGERGNFAIVNLTCIQVNR